MKKALNICTVCRYKNNFNCKIISLLIFNITLLLNLVTTAQEQKCIPISEVINYQISYKIYSSNNKYFASIAGNMNEGFHGRQIISLIEDNYLNRNVWSKLISNKTHIPAVSDSGEVAIINGNKYDVYNRQGNLLYSFIPNNDSEIHGVGKYEHPVHVFSNKKKYFYTILDSVNKGRGRNISQLLTCINNKGELLWKSNLGFYYPTHIHTVNNLIIIDNIGNEGVESPYIIKIFQENGDLIKEIILSKYVSSFPAINKKNSLIHLFDSKKKKIILYDIKSESKMRELSKKDALELLFSENRFEIGLALTYIHTNLNNIKITDEIFKRIIKLSYYQYNGQYFHPRIAIHSIRLIEKIYNK